VGKSTLFNAITCSDAGVSNYPFCTIEPNRAAVPVPDRRLDELEKMVRPKKAVPAVIEFVDIAGLVKGAHRGEGLGNKFLSHIREIDAVVHVVRCFRDEDIAHVSGKLDAVSDIEKAAGKKRGQGYSKGIRDTGKDKNGTGSRQAIEGPESFCRGR